MQSNRANGLVVVALAALTLFQGSTSFAAVKEAKRCNLDLGTVSVAQADNGKVFTQDFYIDAERCVFSASSIRELSPTERDAYFASTADKGIREERIETRSTPSQRVRGRSASMLLLGTLTIFNRHSTWDCCGLETTYTDHQQTFDYDGSTSTVTQIGTTAWWSAGTGWWKVGGPGQFFNTGNPGSSVSTEGYASFNHPIADCFHQLNSETRSFGNGSWTRSSSWSGGMCGGAIHTSSIWGTR